MKGKEPFPFRTMTATEQAIQIIERGLIVAAKDNAPFTSRNVKVSPKGYFFVNGQRCGRADAIQALAYMLNEEAKAEIAALENVKPGKRVRVTGPMTFESLNKATQDYFFELAEEIMAHSPDVNFENQLPPAALLGRDIKVSPTNQPRLTNLKRAGMVETGNWNSNSKSERWLMLTEQGYALFQAHCA